ncbi:MAG: hypothetical protein WCK55_08605 [Verrucomicrobiota bacterium]
MLPRLAAVALLALPAFLSAQSPDDAKERAWKIHVELQAITLPAKDALALLPELSDGTTMPAAWKKLEAMLAEERAKVVALLLGDTIFEKIFGIATPGAKIEAHQGEIVEFPTEFSPPLPIENPETAKAAPKPALGIGFGPTAFASRQTGVLLAADAAASTDGKHITITATLEHVWMLGWQDFEQGRLANNEKILIKQPRFSSVKTAGTFAVLSGERTLLSIHRVPEREREMEIFILRAWTTPRGDTKGPAKAPAGDAVSDTGKK